MGFWKFLGIESEEEELETEAPKNTFINETPASERKPAPHTAPVQEEAKPVNTMTSASKMVIVEPKSFEESSRLVDSLKAKKPVIINLESVDTQLARKIFDFLSGATYALNGKVQKVANNIFVFAPENVELTYNEDQQPAIREGYKSPWV